MGLKTVGTLTWEACKSCKREDCGHGISEDCEFPSLYRERDTYNVGCADYLSRVECEE